VGSHSITAVYSGDSTFATSTSSALTQTVSAGIVGTTTALTSSPNPSVFGQTATFAATVTPSSGTSTPTGTVSFFDGAKLLGSSGVGANGLALFSTSSLSVGTHSITAQYGGDASFAGSTSSPLSQSVSKANTTVTLTSNRNPSKVNQAITFTAAVSPSGATGTVRFFDGSTLLGSGTVSGGVASLTTSSLSVGSHSITAQYMGDGSYNGSTSAVLAQTVQRRR
jgi:hypothetical protein